MTRRRQLMMYAVTALIAAAVGTIVQPNAASAHGAMMSPGSRTYFCWLDGTSTSGDIQPKNPACAAAVAQSGATPLYNWFAVLRSDGAGRTAGFIPDGQLCSGGVGGPYDFTGYNLARADWPVTHLTAGSNVTINYSDWAKHPGTFSLYITKDTWSPTRPLAWSDLEPTPFDQVTDPVAIGGPGTVDGHYTWGATLPANKTGRHLIYSVWSRSDSTETFYGCSDVVFDGGHGEVTGVGTGGTLPPPTDPPTTPGTPGACTATYASSGSWTGGFGANVTVHATGAAISNWTVSWTFPGTQTVAELWSGKLTASGSLATVKNESWNGAIPANGSTMFGFNGNGVSPSALDNLTCTSP